MWRVTLKGILAQRLRLALTGLAIVIGVAFVSGTFVFSDTMNRAFDNLFAGIYADTDVVVQGTGELGSEARPPFDEALLETVRAVDGVDVAMGNVAGSAQVIRADGEALSTGGGPAQGFSWDPVDTVLNPMSISEGRPPQADDEVVLERHTAERGDFAVGQTIGIVVQAGTKRYRVVGVAILGDGTDSFAGATTVFFTLPESQRAFQKQGQLDQITAAAVDGVSQEELRDRIAAVVPGDLEVKTGRDTQREQSQEIKDQLSFLTTFLLVFGFIAVFVAAFIIFNTFSITVAQRARQLALLRAVGASGAQVTRMVVGEAAVVGLVASLLGLVGGFLVAMGVQALFRGFGADLPTTTLQLQPRTIAIGLLVGVVVTLVSALIPAVRAARMEPVAALREDFVITSGSRRRRLILGAIVTVVGAALIAWALTGVDGTQEALSLLGAGGLLVFVGLAMLAPLVAGPVAWVLGAPLARVGGVPGRLGRGNAMRNPQRTAQTATALMIGLALVTFVTVFAVSLSASIGKEIDQQLKADIVVYDEVSFFGFPPAAGEAVRAVPEVETVAAVRIGPVRVDGDLVQASAVDPALGDLAIDPVFVEGGWDDLTSGGALVEEGFADQRDLSVGDTVDVRVAVGGVQSVRIQGIYEAVTIGPMVFTLDDAERWFATQADFLLFVNGRADADPVELQQNVVRALQDYPSLTVRNQQEYKEYIESQVNAFLGLVYALLALAIIIAVFGIVNTLALSVFERTREIGLLRAVGLSSRQSRRMVRYEAVIVALLGGLLGAIIGVIFGAVTVGAVSEITVLQVPLGRVLIFLVLAGLAGVLAAIWPARRAARLDVLKAVTHE